MKLENGHDLLVYRINEIDILCHFVRVVPIRKQAWRETEIDDLVAPVGAG